MLQQYHKPAISGVVLPRSAVAKARWHAMMGSCGHHEEAFDDRDEIFVLTINRLLRNCSIRHTPSEAILVTDGALLNGRTFQ